MRSNVKTFERRIHESLKRIPGVSLRIADAGSQISGRVMGDFVYWNHQGDSFLIACLTMKANTLTFNTLKTRQIEDLKTFNGLSYRTHGVIAIHFEPDDECVLLTVNAYQMLVRRYAKRRASATKHVVEETGYKCARYSNGIWNLEPLYR